MNDKESNDLNRQNAFSRAWHSIRTRYSFATAVFLLIILGMFYIGGRIVLVHFVRDAEKQVQGISLNIGRLVNRDAERMGRTAAHAAQRFDAAVEAGTHGSFAQFMDAHFGPDISVAIRLDGKGRFQEGCVASVAGQKTLLATDIKEYSGILAEWASTSNNVRSAGLLDIRGRTHYGALARCRTGGFLLLGTPFDMQVFTARMNESLSGMEIHVKKRKDITSMQMSISRQSDAVQPQRKQSFGIVPMVSEAINFYSGGFWEFGGSPLEAAFTIRDIAGNPISAIAVSLPRTFASATSVALSRLTFFITMVGILLILPVFWFQNQLLLNPLTTMIERIREVGRRHNDIDSPRLEWTGKDEFAQLAVSVNQMLETISRRSLAVAQSEARQKAMLANIPDGLVVFDKKGKVVSIFKQPDNAKPVPGLTEGETLNPGTYGQDAIKAITGSIDSIFKTGDAAKMQLAASEGEDGTRNFELRFSRLDDFFVLCAIRDITAELAERERLRAAENRLARVQKQESMAQLATGIAHDVNNVLAVVLNTLEITWMDGAESDPIVSSAIATIRDAVRRGTGMMKELMTFAGETKIELKRSSPAELVQASSRLIAGTLPQNVVVDYNLPEDLPAVDADPNQLWKVFFNLAKNAAEAMGSRPGKIKIEAKPFEMTPALAVKFTASRALQAGPGVLFLVSDNGPGIPQDMVRRIFDPYVSTKSAGRGLGLAIVASIVAAHGGGISIRSSSISGTTFSIFLPESKILADATASDAVTDKDLGGDVLVVDDDNSILATTSILLKTLKYEPHTASNPDSALTEFRRFSSKLSCVILDAHLAHFDSVWLLRSLRTADPHVPVIVTSGSTAEETAEMFKSQPYNGFLAKPYTRAELQAALTRVQRV